MIHLSQRSFRRVGVAALMSVSFGLLAAGCSSADAPGSVKIEGDKNAAIQPKMEGSAAPVEEKTPNKAPQAKSIKDRGKE